MKDKLEEVFDKAIMLETNTKIDEWRKELREVILTEFAVLHAQIFAGLSHIGANMAEVKRAGERTRIERNKIE